MAEHREHRFEIDPRYVTWEAFNRRADVVDGRLNREQDDEALYRQRVADAMGAQEQEIVKLRVQVARIAVYLSLAIGLVGLAGGPLITWALLHH